MKSVLMYTTETCPHCARAKKILTSIGVVPTCIDVTGNGALTAEMIEKSGGKRTVPQIFIEDCYVGGADDLQKLHQQNKLLPVLQGEMSLSET